MLIGHCDVSQRPTLLRRKMGVTTAAFGDGSTPHFCTKVLHKKDSDFVSHDIRVRLTIQAASDAGPVVGDLRVTAADWSDRDRAPSAQWFTIDESTFAIEVRE